MDKISELQTKLDELNAAMEKLIVAHVEERKKSLRLDAVIAEVKYQRDIHRRRYIKLHDTKDPARHVHYAVALLASRVIELANGSQAAIGRKES